MFFDLNNRTRLILIVSKPIKIVVVVVVIVVVVFVKNKLRGECHTRIQVELD